MSFTKASKCYEDTYVHVLVASRARDDAEVGGARGDGVEHHRDVQLAAAGSGSQDEETEEGATL